MSVEVDDAPGAAQGGDRAAVGGCGVNRGGGTAFPTKRLKYLVALRRLRTPANDGPRPYVGLEDIESGTGRLTNRVTASSPSARTARSNTPCSTGLTNRVTASSPPASSVTDESDRLGAGRSHGRAASSVTDGRDSLGTDFERGDVLFGKLRPYLAKAWVAEFAGRCTTEALVMEPLLIEPRFLRDVCLSSRFVGAVDASTFGSKMPRAEWDFIGNLPVPVPDPGTQRAIADYLDRETARLDALVTAKERLLALLAEKRRALVTRAVTRGLDPRVPTRDSGVPWLGEIPAHWEIKRLKHVGQTIIGLTYDPKNVVNDDNGVLVLRASNVQDQKVVISDDSMSVVMDIPEHLRTRAGDILICSRSGSRNLIGKSALIGESFAGCTFGVFMTVFRSVHACERYMFCVLNSPMFDFQAGSFSTSTINQLTVETLENMKVPLPPRSEQTEISRYLGGETKRIGLLIDKTRETIHLLSERRAALITAAVTGQTGHLAKDIG